jgi:hypothetical protein
VPPRLTAGAAAEADYPAGVTHHFAGGPTDRRSQWLDSHPGDYVLTFKLPFRPAEMPRRPDGSVDIEAFPEKIFGPADDLGKSPVSIAEIPQLVERSASRC